MSATTSQSAAGLLGLIASRLRRGLHHQDLLFAGALTLLVAVLVLPMPTWVVDIGLSTSITLSVLILMVAIWIEKPLDSPASRRCCWSPRCCVWRSTSPPCG